MKLASALQLGRISNLPTVWTNVLAGVLLAGGALGDPRLPLLMVAMSLFYEGGMFLNDAFDREFDARHRPERPIPSGQASAGEVFGWGFGLLAGGLLLVTLAPVAAGRPLGWAAPASAAALAGCIVLYDLHHKGNPLSPLVMGLCRVLVLLTAALVVTTRLPLPVTLAATALLCHLIGLTYIAKQEHLDRIGALWPLAFLAVPVAYGAVLVSHQWVAALPFALYLGVLAFALRRLHRRARGDVPRAVVSLIAGMSLLDAVVLAGAGQPEAALLAIAAFGMTLVLQKWVSGT